MTWVKRRTAPHFCPLPREGGYAPTPAGREGDLWRCDTCGELWRVAPVPGRQSLTRWVAAGPWQRWRHRRQGWKEAER